MITTELSSAVGSGHISTHSSFRVPSLPMSLGSAFQHTSPAGQHHSLAKKPKLDLSFRVACKDCSSPVPNLVEDFASGDIICRDCGSILMDHVIDTRSEWRTFSNDNGSAGDDPSRVGGPSDPLFADYEGEMTVEATIISKRDGGSGISRDLSRLQSKSTLKSGEKGLIQAFKTISVMCERIGLPKIMADIAKTYFKKVESEKLLRGKSNDGIIAACIYIACRQEKVPRTFREISSLTLVPKKDIGRCYKALAPHLLPPGGLEQSGELSLPASNGKGGAPTRHSAPSSDHKGMAFASSSSNGLLGTVSTQDFMARFCSYLNLNVEIQKAAIVLCQRAHELGCIAGKSPISIAAAGIYMITQLYPQYRKPQKDIAYVAGVSEVTIKNTYKDLYPWRYDLITLDMAPKALVDALPTS